jgi:hypothetical protein
LQHYHWLQSWFRMIRRIWHSRVWGDEYTEAQFQSPNIQTSSLISSQNMGPLTCVQNKTWAAPKIAWSLEGFYYCTSSQEGS